MSNMKSYSCYHLCCRARRRRLRNKANELMADDMSQENDENYARRLMQRDPGMGKRCPASVGEYTPMWELRRTVGMPRANGTPANPSVECAENPYGGTLSIATLPANCCNKSVTFTTFKPGDNPYGTVGRYGPVGTNTAPVNGGVATLIRQQKNLINAGNVNNPPHCLYEQGGELLYSTHSRSRPDILTDSNRTGDGSGVPMGVAGVPAPARSDGPCDLGRLGHVHRSISRDLCEQCVTEADTASSSSVAPPPPPPPGGEIVVSPNVPASTAVIGNDGDVLPGNVMLSSPL